MNAFPHALDASRPVQVGLVVLQADETIEADLRRLMPAEIELLVTRVPSGEAVTPETLGAMGGVLSAAAGLLPKGARLAAVGYGCTSGTAQIGAERVAGLLRAACGAPAATDPLSALVDECRRRGWTRLALLSPYVAPVSERLRAALGAQGIATPVFGSFEVSEEARVARIDGASILAAAEALAVQGGTDATFLSCTNLRTLDVLGPIEARTGRPALSSNLVLATHLCRLAGRPEA